MDQLDSDPLFQSIQAPNNFQPQPDLLVPSSRSLPDCRPEADVKDTIEARKVQKSDREKLRRDRLNEQFTELGNALDPNRPKNDKVSILTDTIQMLKDLAAQVNRQKAEYSTLTEESRELTQEKNDLREEKASLKSDIECLNVQYQQRLQSTYPWLGMDHPVVMHPPSYPFPTPMPMPMPMPISIPTGPIPMHPSMQPYPYCGNQNSTTFFPYVAHNTMMEQQSTHVSQVVQPCNGSHVSSKQDSRNKSSDVESSIEKSDDSNDVGTDLELKTPGSTSDLDSSSKQRKSRKFPRKENSLSDGSSSSGCLPTHSLLAT